MLVILVRKNVKKAEPKVGMDKGELREFVPVDKMSWFFDFWKPTWGSVVMISFISKLT